MTTPALQAALEQIRIIDARSDGVCREVCRRMRVNIFDAGSWQLAWDRYPDLYERRQALSKLRWAAMEMRDAILNKEDRAAERAERAKYHKMVLKRCDACGEYSRIAA